MFQASGASGVGLRIPSLLLAMAMPIIIPPIIMAMPCMAGFICRFIAAHALQGPPPGRTSALNDVSLHRSQDCMDATRGSQFLWGVKKKAFRGRCTFGGHWLCTK